MRSVYIVTSIVSALRAFVLMHRRVVCGVHCTYIACLTSNEYKLIRTPRERDSVWMNSKLREWHNHPEFSIISPIATYAILLNIYAHILVAFLLLLLHVTFISTFWALITHLTDILVTLCCLRTCCRLPITFYYFST